MNAHQSVGIVMIEDDEGHARLIEKNIRRANISNEIKHFDCSLTSIFLASFVVERPGFNELVSDCVIRV